MWGRWKVKVRIVSVCRTWVLCLDRPCWVRTCWTDPAYWQVWLWIYSLGSNDIWTWSMDREGRGGTLSLWGSILSVWHWTSLGNPGVLSMRRQAWNICVMSASGRKRSTASPAPFCLDLWECWKPWISPTDWWYWGGIHRIPEWVRMEGTTVSHLSNLPAQVGSSWAPGTRLCPDGSDHLQWWRFQNVSGQSIPQVGLCSA